MGIDLDTWSGRIIGHEKGVVRLLPVTERARKLLGDGDTPGPIYDFEADPRAGAQRTLFPDWRYGGHSFAREPATRYDAASDRPAATALGDTTLDRVHTAMLLQASGRSQALRVLLKTEQERGPDFVRLANALSALYPQGCSEKRLLDAMLLAVPR